MYVMKISKFLKKKKFKIYIRGEAEYAPRAFFTGCHSVIVSLVQGHFVLFS